MTNIYGLYSAVLMSSDYEAFVLILFLFLSLAIVFPATIAALVMFYFGFDKKKDEIEQAEYIGVEPSDEKYRKFFIIGYVLLIPLFFWLFVLLMLFT